MESCGIDEDIVILELMLDECVFVVTCDELARMEGIIEELWVYAFPEGRPLPEDP